MQLNNKFLAIFILVFTNLFSADFGSLQDELKEALISWKTSEIEKLLDTGADLNGEWSDGQTIFNQYIFYSPEATVLEHLPFLLDHGADLHMRDSKFGYNPLATAITKGYYKLAQKLLESSGDPRGDVNNIDNAGKTMLMITMPLAMLDLLLKYGAADTINHHDSKGLTSLMYIAEQCNLPKVRTLVNAGANYKLTDNDGYNVLHYAENADDDARCSSLISYLKGLKSA
ncbi:hypothetical protein A3F66_06090 [candidate division TM6 bacterium RIFCSPHIGHO2_12_FULL_32_22]|nr:MAG: hypothetical protein A3F66_06090 [candidate division TM6 bacterium RIFCSPHIGHO2_12_FULL_32_22]